MALFRRSPDALRRKALRAASTGPLHDYLDVPLQPDETRLEDLRLLAIDIETTGLDPASDDILSVGFVPVDGRRIVLGGARQLVVAGSADVGQSATVHGLTDDVVAAGVTIEEALTDVLAALSGRVLLAHYARIEVDFLGAACQRLWGAPLACQRVDTLELQDGLVRTVFTIQPPTGQLRLWAARDRYGLPRYRAHEALTDALACAELYLAQTAELAGSGSLTLGRVVR